MPGRFSGKPCCDDHNLKADERGPLLGDEELVFRIMSPIVSGQVADKKTGRRRESHHRGGWRIFCIVSRILLNPELIEVSPLGCNQTVPLPVTTAQPPERCGRQIRRHRISSSPSFRRRDTWSDLPALENRRRQFFCYWRESATIPSGNRSATVKKTVWHRVVTVTVVEWNEPIR